MSVAKEYSVTYKVSKAGALYIYQADKADHKIGDEHTSPGGHIWYSLSDGHERESYGFSSRNDEMFGPGDISRHDDSGYQETLYEVKITLTEEQYYKLKEFSESPNKYGFDDSTYNLLTNSCVDFAYASLKAIGYNKKNFEGDLWPGNNKDDIEKLLKGHGAKIIRDDLTRHGEYYEDRKGQTCIWLGINDQSFFGETDNEFNFSTDMVAELKYKEPVDHEASAAQVAQGLVASGGGGGRLTSTPINSTSINIKATGSITRSPPPQPKSSPTAIDRAMETPSRMYSTSACAVRHRAFHTVPINTAPCSIRAIPRRD